jgi:Rieske Fe-S protein
VENDATPTRRQVVTAGTATTVGLAAAATLTACSGSSDSTATGNSSSSGSATSGGTSDVSPPSPGSSGGGSLAKLSAVPVGGAISAKGADGKPVVIAQPESGKVVAFSAACTHRGCSVTPNGNKLVCPCHGSQFDALTGAALTGPASSPLPAVAVKVNGTDVILG